MARVVGTVESDGAELGRRRRRPGGGRGGLGAGRPDGVAPGGRRGVRGRGRGAGGDRRTWRSLLAATETSGARFVMPGDDEWPDGLSALRYCDAVNRRGGVPFGLWLRGPGHLAEQLQRSVAIVGSRACTEYGGVLAAELAADLGEAGVTVVSGGAYGIDAAAHRGALAVGRPTIAVLANGVDDRLSAGQRGGASNASPREDLLVSELPPGTHPSRMRFLARNRLIAAMSRGTVVVEAALRSGARNTASWALECQRPLMAVPGPVSSAAVGGAAPDDPQRPGQPGHRRRRRAGAHLTRRGTHRPAADRHPATHRRLRSDPDGDLRSGAGPSTGRRRRDRPRRRRHDADLSGPVGRARTARLRRGRGTGLADLE